VAGDGTLRRDRARVRRHESDEHAGADEDLVPLMLRSLLIEKLQIK
jgi:hypothetical protein